MKFMFLIYEDPEMSANFTDADWAQMGRDHGAFAGAAAQAGVMVDGWPLDRAKGNASVSVRDGDTVTTDGPFIETKEQLAGYYILDCADFDDAKAWAARIPSARVGTIEVKAVGDLPGG